MDLERTVAQRVRNGFMLNPTAAMRVSKESFASRRCHTRCLSDWSSDVCSSDLQAIRAWEQVSKTGDRAELASLPESSALWHKRSEERRVGKECRTPWWPYH